MGASGNKFDENDSPFNNDDDANTVEPSRKHVKAAVTKSDEAMIGRKIGRYTIKGVIGSGGMGTVFLAVQEQPRRRVAVKMMKQGISSRSAQRRFEFESQLLARLKHPGIAQVYEAGTHDGGYGERPYFVMEYISNAKTLTEYAEFKKLGTRERLDLFAQVCDAVQHGHLKGIIHRDLKPGNILVGSGGRPRVIDFGVARSTDFRHGPHHIADGCRSTGRNNPVHEPGAGRRGSFRHRCTK